MRIRPPSTPMVGFPSSSPSRSLSHIRFILLGASALLLLLLLLSKGTISKSKVTLAEPQPAGVNVNGSIYLNGTFVDPFKRTLPEVVQKTLKEPWKKQAIPVVFFHLRGGPLACSPTSFIYRSIAQARKLNSLVYFVGPEECADAAAQLDVIHEPFTEYADVLDCFRDNMGEPVSYQVRWFVLRAFMERHALPRVFLLDPDVLLFANITELAEMHFQRMHILLPVRWPSLRSISPSQYASTLVSGHVSLWTHEALVEFTTFFQIFIREAVLFGTPGDTSLVEQRAYSDMAILGWYTHRVCWIHPPEKLRPQCIAEKLCGVTPERSIRVRGLFLPKYRIESLCMPRWCNASEPWLGEGWCAFDSNFAVQTPTQFFKYRPEEGMKIPTTSHYTHFDDWPKEKDADKPTTPVQMLAVHFQAHRKAYLTRGDDPSRTWGSSPD